jgi:hypothetical protein
VTLELFVKGINKLPLLVDDPFQNISLGVEVVDLALEPGVPVLERMDFP